MRCVLIVKLVEQKRGLRPNVGNSCMAEVFFFACKIVKLRKKSKTAKESKDSHQKQGAICYFWKIQNNFKNSKLPCGICLRGRLISLIYEETLSFLWNANFSGGKHESDIKREDWKVEKNPVWKNIFLASKDFFRQTLLNSYIESKSYASKQG